jgi:hypothetical protein
MWRISDTKRKEKCTLFSCVFLTDRRFLTAILGILFLGISNVISAQSTVFDLSQAEQPATSVSANDGSPLSIGMKFRSYTNGFITGLRFYKSAANTGTHIGQLWSASGTLLGEATFVNETASGWQQVALPSPVAVTAGTTYIVSYHSSTGNYNYTEGYFSNPVENGLLKGLGNGEDGPNGVYLYTGTPAFPINSYKSSNYWVDVEFNVNMGPDLTLPAVSSVSPLANATNVTPNVKISAVFSEPLDIATVTNTNAFIEDGSSSIPVAISYANGNTRVLLSPLSQLAPNTAYTVTLKGGSNGIKDLAGNALAVDYIWSFTTGEIVYTGDPNQGPGGPILVVSSSSNPFSRYAAEILRAEGLNEFSVMDISSISAGVLNNYDVVVLGEMSLTGTQASMFTDWVNSGGTFISFKPDADLYGLLGITSAGGTLSDKYLLVNTSSGPGVGIVGQTIQFHGAANQYNLSGATAIASLYSSATTATTYPAVTTRSVGSNGGKAVAFAYDLAKSIVYTRQGNPAWAGQKRDGDIPSIRTDDMFFPDWIDFNKVEIPQADEQQHLLANIIIQGNLNRKPLPRFWILPRKLKAAIVMTGDDHGYGGTAGRFNQYLSYGNNSPEDVADWRAIRGTSYVFPAISTSLLSDAQASTFETQGFEISLHLNTNCATYNNESSLQNYFTPQLASFASRFPSLSAPATHRTHCLVWSDWASKPKVESRMGIRLNTDYYYWPAAWIQDRPGMFTGSGMPMRFADLDGTLIDNYQVTTQMTDESGITYSNFVNTLLDNALGSKGYYGVFCANMHTDGVTSTGSDVIIAAAQARQVPVISAKQMLTWLDGRNTSSFGAMNWNSNVLSFTVTAGAGAHKLQGMLPVTVSNNQQLISITYNGNPVSYSTEIIKGINYAFFDANGGSYQATYALTLPVTLVDFSLKTIHDDNHLSWSTSSESNNKGFEIERSTNGQNWKKIDEVNGAGNSEVKQTYSFTDSDLKPGKYYYRLKQIDFNADHKYSKTIYANINSALIYNLGQNYPNPAKQSTVINYTVPAKSNVNISLYDMQGRVIKSLVNGILEAGSYTYTLNVGNLTNGMYFYKMQTDDFSATKRLIVK